MKVQRIESKEIRDVRVHGGGSIDTKYLAKLVFFWSRSVNSTNLALILVTLVKFPKELVQMVKRVESRKRA